jgi:3'-phosphoadenosine 5'-phosphosulfate sulfotransferase (PAPS reductase)/FAD synthetase
MKNIEKLVESIINNVVNIKEHVWIAGFSGGKDSSLLVDLLTETISKYRNDVYLYVIYADTMLEYPQVRSYAYKYLKELENYANETGLHIEKVVVTPDPGQDFISLQLFKGYPMPHRRFRWCTDKLKIKPASKALRQILKKHDIEDAALFNGSRLDESVHRKSIMLRRYRNDNEKNSLIRQNTNQYFKLTGSSFTDQLPLYVAKSTHLGIKINVYSPLAYLTEDKVWVIIRHRKKPYFTSYPLYEELLTLYGKQSKRKRKLPIRFGCWLCTVTTIDKSGQYFAKMNKNVRILVWARKALFIISHDGNINRKGNKNKENSDLKLLRNPGKYRRQSYSSLNENGKLLTQAIYYVVLKKYPDAFKSYFEDDRYNYVIEYIKSLDISKTLKVINNIYKEAKDKELKKILKQLKNKLLDTIKQ